MDGDQPRLQQGFGGCKVRPRRHHTQIILAAPRKQCQHMPASRPSASNKYCCVQACFIFRKLSIPSWFKVSAPPCRSFDKIYGYCDGVLWQVPGSVDSKSACSKVCQHVCVTVRPGGRKALAQIAYPRRCRAHGLPACLAPDDLQHLMQPASCRTKDWEVLFADSRHKADIRRLQVCTAFSGPETWKGCFESLLNVQHAQ